MRLYAALMEGLTMPHNTRQTISAHRAFIEIMVIMLVAWVIVYLFSLGL